MRVTLAQALLAQDTLDSRGHRLPLQDVQEAIATAMADVRDPEIGEAVLRALSGRHVELQKKLYLAEAKIARIREQAERYGDVTEDYISTILEK